ASTRAGSSPSRATRTAALRCGTGAPGEGSARSAWPATNSAWSRSPPDGRRVAGVYTTADGGQEQGVWDATTGKPIAPHVNVDHPNERLHCGLTADRGSDSRNDLWFSDDGRLITWAGKEGVDVWDAATGEAVGWSPAGVTSGPITPAAGTVEDLIVLVR